MSNFGRLNTAYNMYRMGRAFTPYITRGLRYLSAAQSPVSKSFPTYRYPGYIYPGKSMSGYAQGRSVGSAPVASRRIGRLPIALAPRPKGKKTLVKRVKNLERRVRDEDSILTYKVSAKDTLRPSVNQAFYGYASCLSIANIEAAAANARFFDPATPGTLVTASLVTGTYGSKFRLSARCSITIKNNYQVPCIVHVGMVAPRFATSTSPNQAYTNGLTDQGNPTSGSPMLHWSDSKQFTDTYKITRKIKKILLMPGAQRTFVHKQASFLYDPSYFDTNTETYQSKARSRLWIYRCQGVPGHDTAVSTEQGILPSGIDVYAADVYTIHYNSGGATLHTIVLSEGAATAFTNAGVVSQIVADNQSYSIA